MLHRPILLLAVPVTSYLRVRNSLTVCCLLHLSCRAAAHKAPIYFDIIRNRFQEIDCLATLILF